MHLKNQNVTELLTKY